MRVRRNSSRFDYEVLEDRMAEIRKEVSRGDTSHLPELRDLNRAWAVAKNDHQKLLKRVTRAMDSSLSNPSRRNPTKKQKREKAAKKASLRRVAEALKNFVRKANPAAKGVVKATKVKGGWNVRVVDVRRAK